MPGECGRAWHFPQSTLTMAGKKLRRFGMIDSTDATVEGLTVEFLVAPRALARGGMGFVSRPVTNHAFALLYTLESMWKWGRPKPKAVWQYLHRITRVVRQSFTDEELATLSHASFLTCFSEFPLGLMTLPYASSPLCCHIPIAYRPLMPLSRALLIELTPVPIVYVKEQLRILVAECLSADDPVGRLSRVGWRTATQRLLGNTNIVCRVQDITSVAAFRSALREADYDILVISAHGGMEPRQHRTGFWCGNELVVEEELGPLPKIVCFSSCQVSPRGYGTTNITDLMYRQGAVVVLGTLVPINVVRNAVLMTRFFNNITEAQQGKMPENTFDAVWQLTASSNAVNDVLGGNMSLLQDLLEAKDTPNIFEEFMLDRSRGRLRLQHMYQDTEVVLRDIAKDRGILDRFNAWMRSQGYLPESLFYVMLGYPERIVFYDATIEKSLC